MSITLVSADAAGNEGNLGSFGKSATSADGRYVVFHSLASNLVAGDTNLLFDIFRKDTLTGAIERVSTDAAGGEANGQSLGASISADGRYVAFTSEASNLVAGDTNSRSDVFVKDMQTGDIARVSTNSVGGQGDNDSGDSSISADGRYVTFISLANNLMPGDTNIFYEVFVKDTQTGAISHITGTGTAVPTDSQSFAPVISADGRYVAFSSTASNLVAGDSNSNEDIFLRDTQTGTITRISTDNGNAQADGDSYDPSISADGRYVAFYSDASNLVPDDTNGVSDVFVKDTQTDTITRVSTSAAGGQGNNQSSNPSISADGRYVAFHSLSSNFVAGDTNGVADVFVKDTQTGAIIRYSVDAIGVQGNLGSFNPALSADGSVVAFLSLASNLVAGDTNNQSDVFVVTGTPATLPLFTAGADVVDLGSLDLTLYTIAEATDALDGDDVVTLSSTQNIGVLFDAGGGNDAITGATASDVIDGGTGNDTFIVTAATLGAGASYDGGDDDDTLRIDGGGTVDLTGVTFSNMENAVVTNAAGTRVILSTAQINAFTGTLDAQGTADAFAISDFSFLTTFGSPATRASAFELIQDLHASGVETVEWQEAGATHFATKAGTNLSVLSVDPLGINGGLSWATSIFTFDGTTGERISKVTNMDDGSVVTRLFSADAVISDGTAGMAGPTESITVVYDAAGRVDSRTVTYDDDSSVETFYDDDNRVDSRTNTASNGFATTTFFDDNNRRVQVYSDDSSSNIYGWENSTLTLDPLTGQVTEKFTELNNFNTVTETYSGGVLALRVTADGGDNEAFTSATQHFAAGVFQWQSTIYDNGTGFIQGSSSANVLNQNDGINDAMAGGGGADTFVFAVGGGADRVLDFSQAQGDKLDLRVFAVNDVSDIESYTQLGANLRLNFGGGDTVQINNITYAALTNADLVA